MPIATTGAALLFVLMCPLTPSAFPSVVLQSTLGQRDQAPSALRAVGEQLGQNKLGIRRGDLSEMKNPKGAGTFVYAKQTLYSGVERLIIWLVVDGEAYSLNGGTAGIFPKFKRPSVVSEAVWKKTGLNQFSPSEALDIVFGKQR